MPTLTKEMRIRAERAEIDQLVGWIGGGQNAEVSVSGPNEAGIYQVKVEAPIEQSDDIDAATSKWNLDHPGAIIPPDDWLPTP